MNRRLQVRLLFVTGSDTGVGKTVLTALLLAHLRSSGAPAFALKPFCSGGRHDAQLLEALQDAELSLEDINPLYFPEPLAPLVAARKHHRGIRSAEVLHYIRSIAQKLTRTTASTSRGADHARRPTLLIEGAGGLLVPIAEDFSVLDLIRRLRCEVLVVAPNQLGTINHTLLTVAALRHARLRSAKVVLMDTAFADSSSKSNPGVLKRLLAPVPLLQLPFLRPRPCVPTLVRHHANRLRPLLTRLLR